MVSWDGILNKERRNYCRNGMMMMMMMMMMLLLLLLLTMPLESF